MGQETDATQTILHHWALKSSRGWGMQTGAFPMLEACGGRASLGNEIEGAEGRGGRELDGYAGRLAGWLGSGRLMSSFGVSAA